MLYTSYALLQLCCTPVHMFTCLAVLQSFSCTWLPDIYIDDFRPGSDVLILPVQTFAYDIAMPVHKGFMSLAIIFV